MSKEPASDTNNEVAISTSPASWLKVTIKSVKLSQLVFDKEIDTSGEKSKTTQAIENGNAWTSIFPNSESIVEVIVKEPALGLINTLRKLIVLELPLVKLFPSAIEVANILTPGFKLLIVKVPKTNPVAISWDSIMAWVEPTVETTTKLVFTVLKPAPATILAEPITSPEDMFEMSKEPASDTNNEVAISGSLASWITVTVKSVKLSQSVLESEIETVGENGIQEIFSVLPPTQLPQTSTNALPPESPLQSKFWALTWVGINKKPKEQINNKLHRVRVEFLFIILVLILVVITFYLS